MIKVIIFDIFKRVTITLNKLNCLQKVENVFSGSERREGRGQLWCCIWPLPPHLSGNRTRISRRFHLPRRNRNWNWSRNWCRNVPIQRTSSLDKLHNYKEFVDLHEELHKETGICKDLPKLQITLLKTRDNNCIYLMVLKKTCQPWLYLCLTCIF